MRSKDENNKTSMVANKKIIYLSFTFAISIIFLLSINFSFAAQEVPLHLRDSLPGMQSGSDLDTFARTDLFTGSFRYTYDIEVPPGVNELQPALSILYSSQRTASVPDILGTGWDITESFIQRDVNSTVNNLSDDKFTLIFDGSSYELVYVPTENKYHTKIETFLSIENKTTQNNEKGIYWSIKTNDGRTYRFGFNNDSELVSNLGNFTLRWYLDLINDTYNNSVFYTYKENPYSGETGTTYISNITYNNDKIRLINFTYESSSRPDIWTTYSNGNKINFTRRLAQIDINVNNSLVRSYQFQYITLESINSRSFLKNITAFGSDGTTILGVTNFTYNPVISNWTENSSWHSPYCFINNDLNDEAIRLMDINGDGLVDLLQSRANDTSKACSDNPGIASAYINNGSNWVKDTTSTWVSPVCFLNASFSDEGTRFADVNGDGLIDILRSKTTNSSNNCSSPGISDAYINNGSGWVKNNNWAPPLCFINYQMQDEGTRLEDVNGDGLVDIIRSKSDGSPDFCTPNISSVWINNGTGWVNDTNWTLPVCIVNRVYGDGGTRFADVNGDGLVDILFSHENEANYAYINNGTGWVRDDNWISPMYFIDKYGSDYGTRLADINGDGLIDLIKSKENPGPEICEGNPDNTSIYLNNGRGWVDSLNSWKISLCITSGSEDEGTRLIDANGDGLVDLIRSRTNQSESCNNPSVVNSYMNNGDRPYLLSVINLSLGGSVTVNYKKSTNLDNRGNDSAGDLGFNIWVVSEIGKNNGMNDSHKIATNYSYNYSGGMYKYKDQAFAGFAYAEETRPDGTKVKHYFYQDEPRMGREYKTEIFDSQNNLYQRREFKWNSTTNTTDNVVRYIVQLSEDNSSTYDGEISNPKISKTVYGYDNYGNIVERYQLGNTNITGDEKYERYEYVYNSTAWIVNKPKRYTLFASDNSTVVRAANYSYDNLSYGAVPNKGSVTKKEDILTGGSNPVATYSYNSHGNIIAKTDPNSHTTNYTYGTVDTTYTFPDKETNAKNYVTKYTYNLGLGKITSVTDPNGIATNYTYDALGRLVKEVKPYDSASYPSTVYEYSFDGIAPEQTKILKREQNGTNNTYDTYQFIDGFGNIIQTKTEAENNKQIVTDTFYDGLGRLVSKSNPYFYTFNSNYTSPNTSVKNMTFTYDPMGRTARITNPDSTFRTFNYTKWNITSIDENGHKIIQTLDAFGQITTVYEFNGNEIYLTTYSYNTAGDLLNIVDNQGNTFSFTYNSLGRKTNMSDPDMGVWSYTYDSAGNLITQTDSRNIKTYMVYDAIDRITRRNSSSEYFNFSYDAKFNGTLSYVETINYTVNFSYDSRLRKTIEIKNITSNITTINYSYDSLDRLVNTIVPNGTNGGSTNITYNYSYQNTIKSVTGILNNIQYNELSNLLSRAYYNLLSTNFTYDPNNLRLTAITTGSKQNIIYAYDNASNVVSMNDTIHSRLFSMAYDALNRLVSAQRTDNGALSFAFNYTYSSIGNLLKIINKQQSQQQETAYFYNQTPAHAPYMVSSGGPLYVDSFEPFYISGTLFVFKFVIINVGTSNITGINWTLQTGAGNITSTSSTTLQPDETIMEYVQYNYTTTLQPYTATIIATNGTLSVNSSIQVPVPLQIDTLQLVNASQTVRTFNFLIRSTNPDNISLVNWTLQTGIANITSSYNFTLQLNETMMTFVQYNYTSSGSYTAIAKSQNPFLTSYTKSIPVTI